MEKNAGLICDYEVLQILGNLYTDKNKRTKHINNILYLKDQFQARYFNSTVSLQTDEICQKFVSEVAHFRLTNAEILQIINMRPKSLAHLVTIVEEMEERLTNEQSMELLHIILRILPKHEVTNDDAHIQMEMANKKAEYESTITPKKKPVILLGDTELDGMDHHS